MRLLEDIEGLVTAKIAVLQTCVSLFKLEANLASLSIYPLLLNMCMILIVLTTTWGSATLLLGYAIFLVVDNLLLSMGIVLLLNLILMGGLLKYLSYNLKKMSFEKTREFISNKENHYAEPKKKISGRHSEHSAEAPISAKPGY